MRIIVTAALPYANGFLHLGHIASTFLPADIYARFLKLKYGKENVVFISATDEHGTPIELNAIKHNLHPKDFVKIFRKEHKEDLERLEIIFDNFYYTHSKENKKLVYEFYKKAKQKGLIYEKEMTALFCERCNRFLPDRFVKGTCPFCGAEDQYGDVCEVCGRTYTAKDLLNPRCILCNSTPVIKKTTHLFFALSKLQKDIEEYLKKSQLQEDAKNYALSWIKDGLRDIDITRDAPYFGFPVPDKKNKYFYVWVDAPFGYIASTTSYNSNLIEWWKDKNTKIVHFMGKDIIYFHYIYWIAMLIAGDYSLPDAMPVRGYLTLNKKKMSKTRGNFVYLRDLEEFFDSTHIRYYFARSIPDNIDDGDFSYDAFKDKVNKELIGIIANLGYRMMKIANKMETYKFKRDIDLSRYDIFKEIDVLLEKYAIKGALEKILEFAVRLNEKFNTYEPWRLIKEKRDEDKIDELFEEISVLFALLEPYLPKMVNKFYDVVGLERSDYTRLKVKDKVKEAKILVDKIDEKLFLLASGGDMFSSVDLKIGLIKEVEDIKQSEKLYYITLDVGDKKDKRIVAGIKRYYSADELVGKRVVFVNNLKKAKIMGYESEGMLLAASSKNGDILGIAIVEDPLITPGSDVIIKGVVKKPKEIIDIEEFRKIELIKNGDFVYYKGYKLIARSAAKEEEIKIDRAKYIEDGVKLW